MSDNTSRSDCNGLKREDVEQNLNCPGFLVMTSPLKKETKKTLLHLHDAMERIIMITGDNEYTACDVAVRSGLVLSSNPIGASGMIRFGEAALQVMGLAEDHQVEDAKVAMGHAYGGAAQFFAMWIVSSSLD